MPDKNNDLIDLDNQDIEMDIDDLLDDEDIEPKDTSKDLKDKPNAQTNNQSEQQNTDSLTNKTFKQKLKAFFKGLWQNPKKRWSVIIGGTFILIVIFLTPFTRYFILNTVGVRVSASVKVYDESTSQPLKNVSVKLSGVEAKTNDEGVAKLENLKLGKTQLVIQKRAFAENKKTITLGWGSNPLGEQKIKPVGLQYSFDIKDFLSGKSINKAEAVSGEYSAFSDDKGRVVLTIDQPGEDIIKITIKAKGYRDESVNQETENKDTQSVAMVPQQKHFFVSKRSGKYDVYKVDVDGKNEQLVLSGTGNEREDITLVAKPDNDIVALVSSRDNTRNKDGFLLSTLTLINLKDGEIKTDSITKSERVQIIGWSGDWLVYVKIADGTSASKPDRHRLISYNIENSDYKELAKSNYFNDITMIGDTIYYAPSGALQTSPVAFYSVNTKGENQKTVFENEIWNMVRTDYDSLMFSVKADWYEYDLSTNKVLAASGPPSARITRIYIDGPEKKKSLWVDQRDGKGALLAYDTQSKADKIIKTQSGLTYPVLWANADTVIYRINTDQEVADYVINLDGGEPKKIKDVTKTGGIDRWYYY